MGGIADVFVRLVRVAIGLPEEPGAPPAIPLLGFYRAEVKAVNSDGTVDVQPENATLSGIKTVRALLGAPGLTATPPVGAIVRLAWMEGDPSKPYGALWDGGELLQEPLAVNGDVSAQHLIAASASRASPAAPIQVSAGAALGSGGTAELVDGHDTSFEIKFTPSGTPTPGPLATITLERDYPTRPRVTFGFSSLPASLTGAGIPLYYDRAGGGLDTFTLYTLLTPTAGLAFNVTLHVEV